MKSLLTKTGIVVLVLLLAIAIYAALFFFCRPFTHGKIRNVLLISIDTCRADYLSCYGFERKTTPNIDRLAADGILFENAITPVPQTLPGHSSMLTGTIPPHHGVHDNLGYRLDESNITLAEILDGNGFVTAAFVSAFVIDSQFGLSQGFDTYDDRFADKLNTFGINERTADETSSLAIQWLDDHKAERFFLFLHYFDPHAEYIPPEPFRSKFADNPYAGEIAYTDHWIGQVFKKLKEVNLYDSTLIIVTSDHGEMLYEHREKTHDYFIYQGNMHVPLIIKLPGNNKPSRIEQRVGIIDILPTVCSLLNIESPSGIQGEDLSAFINKSPVAKERYLFCESLTPTRYKANTLLGLVTDRYKYIQTTRPELYDLIQDPSEENNLIQLQAQRGRILQERLRKTIEKTVKKAGPDGKVILNEDVLKCLRSLGYTGGSVTEDFTFDRTKEDPKDLIDFHVAYGSINTLITSKQYAKAEAACNQLLSQRPDFAEAHIFLADIDTQQNSPEQAISHLQDALQLKPQQAFLTQCLNSLGLAYLQTGRTEQAGEYFQRALKEDPLNPGANKNFGAILFEQGKKEEAIRYLQKAVEIDPDDAGTHKNLGLVLLEQQDTQAAMEYFNNVLTLKLKNSQMLFDIGIALVTKKKFDLAAAYCAKAKELFPNMPKVYTHVGNLMFQQGKADQALQHFETLVYLWPDEPQVYNNLGTLLARQKKLESAVIRFQKALELDPKYIDARFNLAYALTQQGQTDLAVGQYNMLLEFDANNPQVYNYLGSLHAGRGGLDKAVGFWSGSLDINPNQPKVLNQLAWLMATAEDEKLHDPTQALRLAQQACKLTDFKEPQYLDTLAVAYAAAQNFTEAVETCQKALEIAKTKKDQKAVEIIEKHLELYKAGRPYRELSKPNINSNK